MDNVVYDRRKKAFAIDTCIIAIILFICSECIKTDNLMLGIAYVIGYGGLLFKDIYKGQSVGKRIYKIAVVSENGCSASLKQLILRNVTLVVWPIEAYRIFSQRKPRLGDVWAKTKVISICNIDPK